jgi:hypothetical protein
MSPPGCFAARAWASDVTATHEREARGLLVSAGYPDATDGSGVALRTEVGDRILIFENGAYSFLFSQGLSLDPAATG